MLKNNKINLLISIVCAIVLWAYITTVVNPETERTVSGIPVDLVNIDALNDRGYTVDEATASLVDVLVRGARSEVAKLGPADFKATADVTGYNKKGVANIPVHIVLPNNIELTQVRPEAIQVGIVDLITVFKPVRLEFEEEFPRGWEPGFIEISPEEMEVSGVAEAVDSIDYIRALVKEGSLTEEMDTFRLDVVAIDKSGQPVYNVRLSQPSVAVTGVLCMTKTVPLRIEKIGEVKETIEISNMYIPGYITIRGTAEDLEEVTEVEGLPIDLSSIIITEEIPVELYPIEGVEVADASEGLSIRIEVQGIAKKEFEYTADMVEITNLVTFLSGRVNTESIIVTIVALQDIIDDITQDDIKLFIDASDQHRAVSAVEIEVEAEYEVELKDITIEPAKVRVSFIRER